MAEKSELSEIFSHISSGVVGADPRKPHNVVRGCLVDRFGKVCFILRIKGFRGI